MRDAEGTFTWEQIDPFENPLEKAVTLTALPGVDQTSYTLGQRIRTSEFTAQGMAVKVWIREAKGPCLYKARKGELPASRILGVLILPHIGYMGARNSGLEKIADRNHIDKMYKSGENCFFRR